MTRRQLTPKVSIKPRTGLHTDELIKMLRKDNLRLKKALSNLKEKYEMEVKRDVLTGLGNRKKMDESLLEKVTSLTRSKEPITVVSMDMNNFKKINDTKGHKAGDRALKRFADILGGAVRRATDIVCRMSGDEFVAILPNTNKKGAKIFITKVESHMSKYSISASFGSATRKGIIKKEAIKNTINYLLSKSDRRMYKDKAAKGASR